KVSGLRHAPEPFVLHCPSYRLDAWRWGFTVFKKGQNDATYVFDWVVVRMKRVVISFSFYSVDAPFGAIGRRLVSDVLARAERTSLAGCGDSLESGMHAQCSHEVAHVIANRLGAQVKVLCNLPGRASLLEKTKHLGLAWGQVRVGCRCRVIERSDEQP